MNFDYIIGNPPYSIQTPNGGCTKNLDNVILEKVLGMTGKLSFIIRSKHFHKKTSQFRKRMFGTNKVSRMEYLDGAEAFGISSLIGVCVITIDDAHKGPCTVVYKDGVEKHVHLNKDTVINFNNPDYAVDVENNMAYRWHRGDISRNSIVDDPTGRKCIEVLGGNIDNVIPVIRKTNQTDVGYSRYGVIMNRNCDVSGFGKLMIKPNDCSFSLGCIMLETGSDSESKALLEYLESEDIREFVAKNKPTFSNNKMVFSMIPDLKWGNK